MKRAQRWHGMRRARVAMDLGLHFRDQVLKHVEDTVDTGDRGGVPVAQTLGSIINGLLYMAAMFSYATGGKREQFLEHCGKIYDAARLDTPMLNAIMERHARLREGLNGRNKRNDH